MTDVLDRLDLLGLDADLSDDNRLLRDTVRKFADDRLRPNIRDWYEAGTLPARELAREFGELGVLGMHLSGYGCQGSTAAQYGLVCAEVEAVDSGLRSLISVQGSLAMYRDLRIRQRRAETALATPHGCGRSGWVFRPDRGRLRIRSRLDAHPRGA